VYDVQPGERSGYVAFFQVAASSFPMHLLRPPSFLASRLCETRDDVDTILGSLLHVLQDNGGSAESGGDGEWAGEELLRAEERDKGFVLGTDQGAFSFAVAYTGTNRLDYLSSQACASRHHLGSWVHLAETYDGSAMKLYVNGVKSAVGYTQNGPIAWPTLNEPAELTLGAWLGTKKQTYFNEMLDEVRIWSKPLPERQFKATCTRPWLCLRMALPGTYASIVRFVMRSTGWSARWHTTRTRMRWILCNVCRRVRT
jgi:hypothetical protein